MDEDLRTLHSIQSEQITKSCMGWEELLVWLTSTGAPLFANVIARPMTVDVTCDTQQASEDNFNKAWAEFESCASRTVLINCDPKQRDNVSIHRCMCVKGVRV